MSPCHGEDRGFDSRQIRQRFIIITDGSVAQLVEHQTENLSVAGALPAWATTEYKIDINRCLFSLVNCNKKDHFESDLLFSLILELSSNFCTDNFEGFHFDGIAKVTFDFDSISTF